MPDASGRGQRGEVQVVAAGPVLHQRVEMVGGHGSREVEALAVVAAERGQLCLVLGAPGFGKSVLLRTLAIEATWRRQ